MLPSICHCCTQKTGLWTLKQAFIYSTASNFLSDIASWSPRRWHGIPTESWQVANCTSPKLAQGARILGAVNQFVGWRFAINMVKKDCTPRPLLRIWMIFNLFEHLDAWCAPSEWVAWFHWFRRIGFSVHVTFAKHPQVHLPRRWCSKGAFHPSFGGW